MSSILLAGLTDHEAAAIEIMVGMNWSDRHVLTIARGVGLGVPEQTPAARACTHCVLDLFGFGLRRYSAENEVKLRAFLGNRSAVLLIWGNGSGWLEQHLRWAHGQAVAVGRDDGTAEGAAFKKILNGNQCARCRLHRRWRGRRIERRGGWRSEQRVQGNA